MARLDRMEGDRDVAQLAATLGREFSYELLAAVVSVDEPTLQAELAKLVQAEILYTKGRAPALHLHLQARAGGRRLVQRAGEGQAAAVPRADRRGAGSAVPADRRRRSRNCSPTISPRRAWPKPRSATGSRQGCARGNDRRRTKRSAT